VSHTIENKDGSKQSVGIIYPGAYSFNTGAPERMDIIAGACKVRVKGKADWEAYKEDTYFEVPANSSFEIVVEKGITEYLCTYGKTGGQSIEQIHKSLRLQTIFGMILFLIGLVTLIREIVKYHHGVFFIFGIVLIGVGLIWGVVVRVRTWWHTRKSPASETYPTS